MLCYQNLIRIPSLLPSIMDRSMASTKPAYICTGIGVSLLYFQ